MYTKQGESTRGKMEGNSMLRALISRELESHPNFMVMELLRKSSSSQKDVQELSGLCTVV